MTSVILELDLEKGTVRKVEVPPMDAPTRAMREETNALWSLSKRLEDQIAKRAMEEVRPTEVMVTELENQVTGLRQTHQDRMTNLEETARTDRIAAQETNKTLTYLERQLTALKAKVEALTTAASARGKKGHQAKVKKEPLPVRYPNLFPVSTTATSTSSSSTPRKPSKSGKARTAKGQFRAGSPGKRGKSSTPR